MSYLLLLIRRALKGSVLLTDKMAIIAGALIPALVAVTGDDVADTLTTFSAWIIIITMVAGIALRLVTAPYFIWKEDRQRIQALEDQLLDRSRQRRQFFEERFLEERAVLAKSLAPYVTDWSSINTLPDEGAFEVRRQLYPMAAIFLGDQKFNEYWEHFLKGVHWAHAGLKKMRELSTEGTDVPPRLEKRTLYDGLRSRFAAEALIRILTEDLTHSDWYDRVISEADDAARADGVDLTVNPIQICADIDSLPPTDTEEGKQD